MEFDPHDRLLDVCRNSFRYPRTLLKRLPRSILEQYQSYLEIHEANLFDSSKARILLWEAWSEGNRFEATEVKDLGLLNKHLIRAGNEPDPRYRHFFIESEHSRAPLNCSPAMLKLVLTFHQVDPSFLDCLLTFGDQDEPQDACLSQFQCHDALEIQDRLPYIPELGRSGKEIRCSFLLRSVESAPEATSWPWSIRQLAVYHSFDISNGRTVWITTKGNDLMQKRIMEDTIDMPALGASAGRDVSASFEAALGTLLIYFTWSAENWRWFVRDIENLVRQILAKAKTVPVDQKPHFVNAPPMMSAGLTTSSKTGSSQWNYPLSEKHGIFGSFKISQRSWRTSHPLNASPAPQPPPFGHAQPGERSRREMPDDILVLELFNYKDLQKLNNLGERLEGGLLAIDLILGVLRDISDNYKRLAESEDIGGDVKAKQSFTDSISRFLTKTRRITRSLETRQTQLISLQKKLKEGKTLFESLLQFRGLQVGRIFAEHGHKSALVMQNIAYRTEQETVTVRVITVTTLLFLPATFLSSFFQSGIINWDHGSGIGFRADVFKLFIAICVPFTAAALIGWLVANKWGSLRLRRKSLEDTRVTMDALVQQHHNLPV
ncbi:hypothetical protein B0T24DRAFT_385828 [Lasiosphaeria ovina]|uniref:CorA-like transporter domain-containing protein n=1 Tax=Lasiosphaeria ovina TaxID=92902 RepID=A0AAE0N1X5_9PEZI|nr:hypothetical protein B0T24DRAFT_385828 [Lasiosphaeria ovina]